MYYTTGVFVHVMCHFNELFLTINNFYFFRKEVPSDLTSDDESLGKKLEVGIYV